MSAVRRVVLAHHAPLDAPALLAFLGARAIPGVEEFTRDGRYRRTLRLPGGPGIVALRVTDAGIEAELAVAPEDEEAAIAACRHLLDLDAEPARIDGALRADPLLAPLLAARPGLRCPGHVDPTELVTRAILGQQVSVARARVLATGLAVAHGTPLEQPDGTLTHLFPDAATIATLPTIAFAMPRARSTALATVADALATGELDLRPGADRDLARAGLLAIKGIGPWTAGYVAMRALGDPDVWLPTDVGVRNGLARLGVGPDHAERWRPWRSYALMHLWAVLGDP